ncbi:MAG TPA: hypothetical protein VEI52_16375 [Terriglobales bacterium]|nr:hypothetical protein [Terriglobales bacterium]
MGDFALWGVTQVLPQAFRRETEEPIGSGIGKENPVEFNAEVEMKAGKRDRASDVDESPNHRFSCNQVSWECQGGEKRPQACHKKASHAPEDNSAFHTAAPAIVITHYLTDSSSCKRTQARSSERSSV